MLLDFDFSHLGSYPPTDEEPPRVDWCDSPPIFLSHDEDVDVYWEEPIFSDNSGKEVQVRQMTKLKSYSNVGHFSSATATTFIITIF